MMAFFQPDQENKEYVRRLHIQIENDCLFFNSSYFMENYGVNVDHVYIAVGRYFVRIFRSLTKILSFLG